MSFACTLGGLGCVDDDAGRFGTDGAELAEYRQEPGPSLSLTTDLVSLTLNETLSLTATYLDRDGAAEDVTSAAQWSSEDPSIAWVHGGTIVGVNPGVTQITATHAGRSDSTAVTVTTKGLQAIEVVPSMIEVPRGMTAPLRALGMFEQGSPRDLSALVRWESSDPDIAVVDGDLVRARELGTATIEASLSEITGSSIITVTSARLLDMRIIRQRESMPVGATQQLRARGRFSDEQAIDITALAQWGSDDGNLATLNESGLVSAHGAGEVRLWARYLDHVAQTEVVITADE